MLGYDPRMLLLIAAAVAWDDPFTCPTVSTPAELRSAVDNAPSQVLDDIQAYVEAYLDTSMVVDCGSTDSTTCEEASYSAADGATVAYTYTKEWSSSQSMSGSWGDSDAATILRVDWPDGRWAEEVTETNWAWDDPGDTSSSSSSSTSVTLTWGGALDAAWPADSKASHSWSSSVSESSMWLIENETDRRCGGTCCWYASDTVDMSSGPFHSRSLGDASGSSTYESCDAARRTWSYVEFNDEDWANIDPGTWELSGEDSDGDHITDDADCAPDDPTVRPCQTETPYDGIDQDCSGSDTTDADGDGHDAAEVGGDDCDDADEDVHPGAYDDASDGVDQDCNGVDGWWETDTGDTAAEPTPPPAWSVDGDVDEVPTPREVPQHGCVSASAAPSWLAVLAGWRAIRR